METDRQWGADAVGSSGDGHVLGKEALTPAPCTEGWGPQARLLREDGAGGLWGTDRHGQGWVLPGGKRPHPCGESGAPQPLGARGWADSLPPSPGAAGGAGDERELQSRAATADAARAIDCRTSAVQVRGQHRGVGETPTAQAPSAAPGGWLPLASQGSRSLWARGAAERGHSKRLLRQR